MQLRLLCRLTYIKALVRKSRCVSLLVEHAQLSHLVLKEQLELVGALVVFGFRRVVHATVGKDPSHVSYEEALCDVVSVRNQSKVNQRASRLRVSTHLFFNLSPMLLRSIGYLMCS